MKFVDRIDGTARLKGGLARVTSLACRNIWPTIGQNDCVFARKQFQNPLSCRKKSVIFATRYYWNNDSKY